MVDKAMCSIPRRIMRRVQRVHGKPVECGTGKYIPTNDHGKLARTVETRDSGHAMPVLHRLHAKQSEGCASGLSSLSKKSEGVGVRVRIVLCREIALFMINGGGTLKDDYNAASCRMR